MRVKIGDVVDKIVGDEDRFETNLEYYVAGEHIETGRIEIYDRGLLKSDKGNTLGYQFHYPFQAGDVLFMTKNPYLRKCGLADFDGICSIATFVMRAKDQSVLSQRYLAAVMQSDDVWDYLEANKSGSVNYFITWKTLEKYEFELPDISEQNRIADAIWSIEKTRRAYEVLLRQTDELVKAEFYRMFGDPVENTMGWDTEELKKVAPEFSPELQEADEYWWLNLDMIENYSGRIIEKVLATADEIGASTSTFDNTMVLYSKLRPYLNKVTVPDDCGYATTELVGLKPDSSRLNKYFLFNLLRGDDFVAYATGISGGSQMPRMPLKALREFKCILPPLELQDKFVMYYQQSEHARNQLIKNLSDIEILFKAVVSDNI